MLVVRVLKVAGLAFASTMVASAAFAGTAPVPVPEPTTVGLFAMSAAGAAVAYRLFRRK